jgi:homoserine O-succinyltransferase
MPAMIELGETGQLEREIPALGGTGSDFGAESAHITVAFINMMPDSALKKTEHQFAGLFGANIGGRLIDWQKYTIPGLPRSASALLYMRDSYDDLADFWHNPPDAVVVTGTEPKMADLRDEPHWPDLVKLFDWTYQAGIPMLLSCLAAHAAVLHFSGIRRRPLPTKRFGVFDHVQVPGHEMTGELSTRLRVAHSRWNEVAEDDLVSAGYRVLTRSAVAGVDMFTKQSILFCQGHPEYDECTLLQEYRRDVGRYLNGDRALYPPAPEGYFDAAAQDMADDFRRRAEGTRSAALLSSFPYEPLLAGLDTQWHFSAASIVRRWLSRATSPQRQWLSNQAV